MTNIPYGSSRGCQEGPVIPSGEVRLEPKRDHFPGKENAVRLESSELGGAHSYQGSFDGSFGLPPKRSMQKQIWFIQMLNVGHHLKTVNMYPKALRP